MIVSANMNLTPHFTLHEFTFSAYAQANGIDNAPNTEELRRLSRIAELMEQVRYLLGQRPITVTSGFRCEALNTAVGGVPTSAHRLGLACDFAHPILSNDQIVAKIAGSPLVFDQLILEDTSGRHWTHIALSENVPRREVLVFDGQRYRPWAM